MLYGVRLCTCCTYCIVYKYGCGFLMFMCVRERTCKQHAREGITKISPFCSAEAPRFEEARVRFNLRGHLPHERVLLRVARCRQQMRLGGFETGDEGGYRVCRGGSRCRRGRGRLGHPFSCRRCCWGGSITAAPAEVEGWRRWRDEAAEAKGARGQRVHFGRGGEAGRSSGGPLTKRGN